MPALYSHTTRANGTVLTATIYNGDHQNHIDNGVPAQLDDYSVNLGQMQSTIDPGESGTESLPTSLAGELERLRFAIRELKGTNQWYETPTVGSLINVQSFTTTGNSTYTPSAGTLKAVVWVQGGGGGGGGAQATGVGQFSIGAGGGAGGTAVGFISGPVSGTVAVGTGGAGGVGFNAGTTGGASGYQGLIVANGGLGGSVGGASAGTPAAIGGAGGSVPTSGNMHNSNGQPGFPGTCNTTIVWGISGGGGHCPFGGGGIAQPFGNTSGANAVGRGAGGGGAFNLASQSARNGGDGSPGIVVIYEYR